MVKRALTFLVPPAAGIALAFFLAAGADQFHVYQPWKSQGLLDFWRCVISSRFETNLTWAVPIGLAVVAIIWFGAATQRARRQITTFVPALESTALPFLPLCVALFTPLRYLPESAKSGTLPFLLSSTLMGPLLFLAALMAAYGLWRLVYPEAGIVEYAAQSRIGDRALGWWIALAAFAVLAPLAIWYNDASPFGGDQPHYLIVTHSLIEDGDIFIEDDHAAKAYRAFTEHEIEPQYYQRTVDGHVIQAHKFGLSILAVPAYLIAGKLGALLLMAALGALCAAGTYWLTNKFVPDRTAALLATAGVVFTVPALPMSLLFFTEIPSAAFLLLTLNLIFQSPDRKPVRWPWLTPFIIWAMPWLHVRNFVIALFLSGLLIWRLRERLARALPLGLLCAVLALGIPVFNLVYYGEFSLVAELGGLQGKDLQFSNILRSIGGLLLDQEFGLLLYSPLILAAIIGIWSLWRRSPSAAALVVLTTGLSLGPMLLYQMWWGGGSPPARYLAANIHLAALPLAALIAARRGRHGSGVIALALAVSIALGFVLIVDPLTLINNRDGSANMLTGVSFGYFDVVAWWPSCIAGGDRACPLAIVLGIFVAGSLGIYLLINRMMPRISAWMRGLATLLFALLLAWLLIFFAEYFLNQGPHEMAPVSHESDKILQARMRDGFSSIVQVFPDGMPVVPPPRRLSMEMYAGRERLNADPLAPRGRLLALPARQQLMIDFPEIHYAGDYEFTVGLRAEAAPAYIRLAITARYGPPNVYSTIAGGTVRVDSERFADVTFGGNFSWNVAGVTLLVVGADQEIRVTHVISQPIRFSTDEEAGVPAAVADKVTWFLPALRLFCAPTDIFPPEEKGFWTVGDLQSVWHISDTEDFSRVIATLRGRPGMKVRLGDQTIEFGAKGGQKQVSVRVTSERFGNKWYASVPIRVEGSFVPAEVEPGSTDTRRLGVFMTLAPER